MLGRYREVEELEIKMEVAKLMGDDRRKVNGDGDVSAAGRFDGFGVECGGCREQLVVMGDAEGSEASTRKAGGR